LASPDNKHLKARPSQSWSGSASNAASLPPQPSIGQRLLAKTRRLKPGEKLAATGSRASWDNDDETQFPVLPKIQPKKSVQSKASPGHVDNADKGENLPWLLGKGKGKAVAERSDDITESEVSSSIRTHTPVSQSGCGFCRKNRFIYRKSTSQIHHVYLYRHQSSLLYSHLMMKNLQQNPK